MPDRQEQRDREIERTGGRRMASPFSVKLVGVSFVPGYPDNLLDLRRAIEESAAITGDEPFPAILRRDPDNEHDTNAIEVHAPVMGERGMLGHLTRPIAVRMAPELDAGVRWAAEIEEVLILPSRPTQPGVSIRCRRLDEGETLDADGYPRAQVARGGGGRDVFRLRDLPDQPDGDDGVSGEMASEGPRPSIDTSRVRDLTDQLTRVLRTRPPVVDPPVVEYSDWRIVTSNNTNYTSNVRTYTVDVTYDDPILERLLREEEGIASLVRDVENV